MSRTPLLLLLVLPSLACWSCGGEPARSGPVVRDSAGLTVVENALPAWSEETGWRVADTPFLDMGVMDGDPNYQFFQVAGAARLSDGRIAVANAGTSQVRFFDPEGRFLNATGGKGGGPGEFQGLGWVHPTRGDSLLTYDWRNRRASVLAPDGSFARSFDLTVLGAAYSLPAVADVFPDGEILLGADMFLSGEETVMGAARDSAIYYVLDPEGEVRHTLGAFPGGSYYQTTDGESWVGGGLVFGPTGQAVVWDDGFYYGSAEAYEIQFRSRSGGLKRLVRLAYQRRPITREDIDTYIADRMARARNEERRQIYRTMFENRPFPDRMPAYDGLLVDAEGYLWVAEYRPPGDDQPRWRIFDDRGAYLGILETPKRFRIFEIGSDYLLGRWADERDVEHIRMYGLVR